MQKGLSPIKPVMNIYVILVASIAAIAGILFGFDTGVISGAILFIRHDFTLSPAMNGLVVGSVLAGAVVGSAFSGRFADYFGRRNVLIITALVFVVGTLGSAMAHSIQFLIIGRVVVGVAIGIASFTAPLYISEVAPAAYRGALVSLNQLAITLGILLAYLVDTVYAAQEAWRAMFAWGVLPAVILLFGMLFLPKSPRWLLLKGDELLSRRTLKKIRGHEDIDDEIEEIQNSIASKSSWRLLLRKWVWPAIGIGLGLGFFQQCTGINTIIYYAPTVFQLAGFSTASGAITVTSIVGVVNVMFTIFALPLIDRWGRRPLLVLGLSGMLLSLLMLSLAFHIGEGHALLKWMSLFSMVVYIACFAMSLGPIMWLIIAEVFPLEIRGLGTSLMVAASWLFNFLVAVTFLTLIKCFGETGTFLIYAAMSVFGLWFVIACVPETKGTTLEKIEVNLRAGVKSRYLGQ